MSVYEERFIFSCVYRRFNMEQEIRRGKQNSRPSNRNRHNRGGNISTDAPAFHHWLDKLKLTYFLSPKSMIEFAKIDMMTQIHNALLIEGNISIRPPQSSLITRMAASE